MGQQTKIEWNQKKVYSLFSVEKKVKKSGKWDLWAMFNEPQDYGYLFNFNASTIKISGFFQTFRIKKNISNFVIFG